MAEPPTRRSSFRRSTRRRRSARWSAICAAAAGWREILVVDDGSSDDTAARAAGAGRARDPSSLQQGQRRGGQDRDPPGDRRYILIIDGDGQHRAADAARLVRDLGRYDLVVGARSGDTQASLARRLGNATLNRLASFLTERTIPDLTSGLARGAARAARRIPASPAERLFDADDDDARFLQGRLRVKFEPIEAAQRQGASKIRLGADGFNFFLILLKVITIFSPLRLFAPVSAAAFLVGAGYGVWTIATQSHVTNSSVLLIVLSVVILLVGLVSEQISSLRFEGRAMTRRRRALVIVPTYNERENIPPLVDALLRHQGRACWSSTISRRTAPATAPTSWRGGFRTASTCSTAPAAAVSAARTSTASDARSTSGADLVCQMDADFSHDPRALPDLIAATADADVVIGSRYVAGRRRRQLAAAPAAAQPLRERSTSALVTHLDGARLHQRLPLLAARRRSRRCRSIALSPTAIRSWSRCCSWRRGAAAASRKCRSRSSSAARASRSCRAR